MLIESSIGLYRPYYKNRVAFLGDVSKGVELHGLIEQGNQLIIECIKRRKVDQKMIL